MEISRESREEVAPGQRPGEAWATRPLAPDERERIRSFYPRTLGRDYRYLGGTALAAALLGLAGALLLPFPGSSGGRAAQIASGFVYMSLAALSVWPTTRGRCGGRFASAGPGRRDPPGCCRSK
jgi:hypothetical protein